MKVVAINSSPHAENGNTALVLKPFMEGMKEAGAETAVYYTRKMKINPCYGDLHCWIDTPGSCPQQDDMKWLLPEMVSADILVLATPVYFDGMTGPMKNLIDRLTPIGKPFLLLKDGHTRHDPRHNMDGKKVVLVSTCGYWEMDNFDPLLASMKAASVNMYRDFSGALLRPHGPAMKIAAAEADAVSAVLDAARRAGREMAVEGRIADNTIRDVARSLMTREGYISIFKEPE